jgi:hypothetical protein
MPQVGFEPNIPAFERAKTVHALDCATTVIGQNIIRMIKSKKDERGGAESTDGRENRT